MKSFKEVPTLYMQFQKEPSKKKSKKKKKFFLYHCIVLKII